MNKINPDLLKANSRDAFRDLTNFASKTFGWAGKLVDVADLGTDMGLDRVKAAHNLSRKKIYVEGEERNLELTRRLLITTVSTEQLMEEFGEDNVKSALTQLNSIV